jgi:hypothetical protein
VAPGGSNDIAAFRKTPLAVLVLNFHWENIVGDNAYVCSESRLTALQVSGWYNNFDHQAACCWS